MRQREASATDTGQGVQLQHGVQLQRTVALVGLMGAGKSAIGRRLAEKLGASFRDADTEIEAAAGMSIAEIFEIYGEPHFRERERRVIQRLLAEPPHVLATGGGAFMDPETRATIAETAISVWLRVDLETLVARVGRRDTRPLLKNGDPKQILGDLIAKRYPTYAQADIVVDSRDAPHEQAVADIVAALTENDAIVVPDDRISPIRPAPALVGEPGRPE